MLSINIHHSIQVDSLSFQNVILYQLLSFAQNPLWHKEASHVSMYLKGGGEASQAEISGSARALRLSKLSSCRTQ